jgi:hypothetical protein
LVYRRRIARIAVVPVRKAIFALPCVLTIACTRVLGIDGTYAPALGPPQGEGGAPAQIDAGNGGRDTRPPDPLAAGGEPDGTGGNVSMPPEVGGTPVLPMDAGHNCLPTEKWCGTACLEISPAVGCGDVGCGACAVPDANEHAVCTDGKCETVCNNGFVRSATGACATEPPATGGAGGTSGAGGTTPGGAGGTQTGGSGGTTPCDPLACPTCSRGFEGCCIPAIPNGLPSRCGCFYFPPLCTARVG